MDDELKEDVPTTGTTVFNMLAVLLEDELLPILYCEMKRL